jgi:hypothetical protein
MVEGKGTGLLGRGLREGRRERHRRQLARDEERSNWDHLGHSCIRGVGA